ncbi:MAG: acyltransferase [Actinobacteria bacterium]|nr:acyltransferase [Actinomycetota bacterium]
MTSHSKRLDYLDLLRVLALGSVIVFHYFFNGISKGTVTSVSLPGFAGIAKYGYLGVELFFLISGFVILYSTQNRTAREFVKKRFIRLYPMYWMAIIVIFVITNLPFWSNKGPQLSKALWNLTMFPTAFGEDWVDAAHWFLARELQLYVFVTIVLAIGIGRHLPNIFSWWAIIICFWNLFDLPQFEIWYFSGYFALITGGAIIFSIREWGMNTLRGVSLLAAYICAVETRMTKSVALADHRNTTYNKYVVAILVTVGFLLILATLNSHMSSISFKWAGIAGAITYPLFLVHGRLGLLSIQNLANDSNKYLVYPLVLIVVIAIAYGLLRLEKKLLATRLFNR